MKLGVLFTGGKDSTYSAFLASKQNEIACLINLVSENKDSYMFHTIGSDVLGKQAEAMGFPLERFYTKGEKELELADLKNAISSAKEKYGITGVVSGAIASNYQKSRVDSICRELGLESVAPLWGIDQGDYLKALLTESFEVVIIKVSAGGLGEEWLGRKIDDAAISELLKLRDKFGINVSGEGGEYESFVLDCPIFYKRLKIAKARKVWDAKGQVGDLDIEEVVLLAK